MLRSSSHPSRADLPPVFVSSPSIPCEILALAFGDLSSSPCSGGSLDPRFSPALSTSVSLFSLFGNKSAKLSPYFSYVSALFKKDHSINHFISNSFRTLLQNTGGMPLQPRICFFIFSTLATGYPSLTAKSSRIRTYEKCTHNLFRISTYKNLGEAPVRLIFPNARNRSATSKCYPYGCEHSQTPNGGRRSRTWQNGWKVR